MESVSNVDMYMYAMYDKRERERERDRERERERETEGEACRLEDDVNGRDGMSGLEGLNLIWSPLILLLWN